MDGAELGLYEAQDELLEGLRLCGLGDKGRGW